LNDARNYSFSQVPYLEHEEKEKRPINLRERRDVILHQVRSLVHGRQTRENEAEKTFKRWNDKAKRNTGPSRKFLRQKN